MNEINHYTSHEDQARILKELDRLFTLQDKHISQDKKQILLDELLAHGYTADQIIAGLRALADTDLGNIKLATMLASIRDHAKQPEPTSAGRCVHCLGSGAIVLKDSRGDSAAFRCTCENGNRNPKLYPWSGGKDTEYSGKVFTYEWWNLN